MPTFLWGFILNFWRRADTLPRFEGGHRLCDTLHVGPMGTLFLFPSPEFFHISVKTRNVLLLPCHSGSSRAPLSPVFSGGMWEITLLHPLSSWSSWVVSYPSAQIHCIHFHLRSGITLEPCCIPGGLHYWVRLLLHLDSPKCIWWWRWWWWWWGWGWWLCFFQYFFQEQTLVWHSWFSFTLPLPSSPGKYYLDSETGKRA